MLSELHLSRRPSCATHALHARHRAARKSLVARAMGKGTAAGVLVVGGKDLEELQVLRDNLPEGARVVGVGRSLDELSDLSKEDWAAVNVLLSCGVGTRAGKRDNIKQMWPQLTSLRWLHSASVGLEHLLFDELVHSDITVTNAKGAYSHSLAEFALTCCLWFAKDVARLRAQQEKRQWEKFVIQELRGSTLGVVGYGDIGQACARLGRAFGMRALALRRRTERSQEEEAQGLEVFPPDRLHALLARCDYVVLALPHTPATHHLLDAAALAAMKPSAVLVNVGRGPTLEEAALVQALEAGRLRGAGLDVFEQEPLPAESPLWGRPDVLLSPHCADVTATFQQEAMGLFAQNLARFVAGEELQNVCDKAAGY